MNKKLAKFLEQISYCILLFTILAVPLALDPHLVNFYIIPKEYVLGLLVLLGLVVWGGRVIITRQVGFRQSVFDKAIGLFLAVSFLSALLSPSKFDSFLGRSEYFILSFSAVLFFILFYFIASNHLTNTRRWRLALDTLVLSGGISAALFVARTVFGFDILARLGVNAWNVVAPLNTAFGIWLVVIFMLSAGQIIRKDLPVGRSLFNFFVAILALTALLALGFKILWWVFLAGLILLLLLGITFLKEARLGWLTVLFTVLVVSVAFIIFGSPRSIQYAVPPEASLGLKASWSVSSQTLVSGVKNFLLGSGLGSFGVDFSKYRMVEFNSDNLAWSLRFNQPFNSFLGIVAESGLLGFVVFVFLIMFYLGHMFYLWLGLRAERIFYNFSSNFGWQKDDVKFEVFLVSMSWLLLGGGLALTFFSTTLWWAWWFLLALGVVGLGFIQPNLYKTHNWEIEDTPQYSLSFSFILIVILAGVVLTGVLGARLYLAEAAYSSALRSGGDLDVMETKLNKALSFRSDSDNYNVALAQLYLLRAINLSKEPSPDVKALSNLMVNAVNTARKATETSPKAVGIWENLATMYENAAAIIPEARDWAIKSWLQTTELEPTNAALWTKLGNNYFLAGKNDDALDAYKRAVDLKHDYLLAYVGLSKVYESKDDLDNAIDAYQQILSQAAGNADVLYNYGRVLYNRNQKDDRKQAEQIWLKVVNDYPNYSNALYSLGTLYEARGDKVGALKYYYDVRDLNPDNADIAKKIKSLVSGQQ